MTEQSHPVGTLPEYAQRAEERRRAGDPAAAERIVRAGLAEQPNSADAVLVLVHLLLEQDRGIEALGAIEQYASLMRLPGDESTPVCLPGDPDDSVPPPADEPVFGGGVSETELELAFESAQSERERMLDADSIVQQAIQQTDSELSGELASPVVSYATETFAGLLEEQGDVSSASRIREAVASSERDQHRAAKHDRRAATILELERWFGNLRGGMRR